jgi:hypothetical protein
MNPQTLTRIGILTTALCGPAGAADFPEVDMLKPNPGLPNPLVFLDGRKVETKEQWTNERRGELRRLFEHYMYGYAPAPPDRVEAKVIHSDENAFDGKATLKEVELRYGPAGTPPVSVLLVIPNKRSGPAPVFVGMNFSGNHSLVTDPKVALPRYWMRPGGPGVVNNKAVDAGRGKAADVWNIESTIDRGYAVATLYYGDAMPDKNDFSEGVNRHYFKPGQAARTAHDWGAVRSWAWTVSRVVDYLVTVAELDKARIAVVGHSRLGKTALVAAAFDDRIALCIPHQAGCGGTGPSRHGDPKAESVQRINTSFPHWFAEEFRKFNTKTELLPFDQNCLAALVAPRPLLFTNATQDLWANPSGQFEVLKAAEPVYKLLGAGGLEHAAMPEVGTLSAGRLGYFIRPGPHSMNRQDWTIFLDYADKHFGRK